MQPINFLFVRQLSSRDLGRGCLRLFRRPAYLIALMGFALLLLPLEGLRLAFSVALVALSSAILNPIGNLLPKRLSESTGVELTRIAGTFSLAGSSGILMGLLAVTVLSRSAAYRVAIGALFVALISLIVVLKVRVRGAES